MPVEFTDSELRALVLSYCYERRKENYIQIPDPGKVMPDGSESEFHRITGQLVDARLVKAECIMVPCQSGGYQKQYEGLALTASGIDAVERRSSASTPLDFRVVQHFVTVNQPSGPVHIGDNVTIVGALNLLIEKIDQGNGAPAEKAEAKSLVKKLLEHPLTAAVVGAVASKFVG